MKPPANAVALPPGLMQHAQQTQPAPVVPPAINQAPAEPEQDDRPIWVREGRAPRQAELMGGGNNAGAATVGQMRAGEIDPVRVAITPDILGSFQNYQDRAYNALSGRLRSNFDQERARTEQDLINRGVTPGTPGYESVMRMFGQRQDDAYTQAGAQAIGVGLGAQGQAFGQGLAQSTLANELLRARENNATNISIANNSAGVQRQNFLDQLGFNNRTFDAQFGEGNRRFDLGFDEDRYRYDQDLGLRAGAQDMEALTRLFGANFGTTGYNNQLLERDFGRAGGLFGLTPSSGGRNDIDPTQAFGQNEQSRQAAYSAQVAQRNAQMAAAAQIIGAFAGACDRNIKNVIEDADTQKCLEAVNSLPLVRFTYKTDVQATPYLNTFAQEFNQAIHGVEAPTINHLDLFGALIGSVQELSRKVAAMEAR